MEKKIKKIVELVIESDGFTSAEVGVGVMSIVDRPAIEVDFFAFAEDEFEPDHTIILQLAEKLGQPIAPDQLWINFSQQEFSTLGDYLKGLAGLDVLSGDGHRVETKYMYDGPPAERNFCKAMLRLNRLYTIDELNQMSQSVDTGFRHDGQPYSIFELHGGKYCKHYFSEVQVITNPNGETVMINKGPARGLAGTPTDFQPNRGEYRAQFSIEDEDQRIIVGPALIPNKFIIRKDEETGEAFYVYFTRETVKQIAERFLATNNQNNTDINHDGRVMGTNTLLESWLVTNPDNDKSREYGYSLPVGTWCVSYKINDEETWQKIKAGTLRGYSVAGNFIEKMV